MFKNKIMILLLCCYGQSLLAMGAFRRGALVLPAGARSFQSGALSMGQQANHAHAAIRPLTKTSELTPPSSRPTSPKARPVSPRIQQALDTFTPQHQPAIDYKTLIQDVQKINEGHSKESATAALAMQKAENAARLERIKQSVGQAQKINASRNQELQTLRQQNQDRVTTMQADYEKAMAENAKLKAQLAKSQTKHTKATAKIAQLTEDNAISKINAKAHQQDLQVTSADQLKLKQENASLQEQLKQLQQLLMHNTQIPRAKNLQSTFRN